MPEANAPDGVDSSLQADKGTVLPRVKLGEQGFKALKTNNGKIYEEANRNFRMPNLLRVVDEMRLSPPVAIGLNATRILMNRAEMYVEPFDESKKSRDRAKFLLTCLHDMEDSLQVTMQNMFPVLEYGFGVFEKVYRRRLKSNGSKYNDGLIGLRGLKPRPQATIYKWNWSDDGRELLGVSQSIANVENSGRFQGLKDKDGLIPIPREKFVLFTIDQTNGNPEGNSILKAAYLAYKQLTLLTDNMLVGVAKDTQGLPLIQIPPEYMANDATPAQKEVYNTCKQIVNDLASGEQKGIVFPMAYDDQTKGILFDVSLLESKGGKAYDVLAIIQALQANILSVLSCDAVKMGANQAGSLSLQDGDTNMLAMQVSYRLGEIADALNRDLVKQLFELNGWDTSEMPTIKFKDISSVSIETFTKGIQRLASTSTMEINRANLNKIYEVMGFTIVPEDEPVHLDELPVNMTGQQTNASEGLAVGTTGKGTSTTAIDNGENTSDNNADNVG